MREEKAQLVWLPSAGRRASILILSVDVARNVDRRENNKDDSSGKVRPNDSPGPLLVQLLSVSSRDVPVNRPININFNCIVITDTRLECWRYWR